MTLPNATIQRLATGVRGFDAVLGGGLPEFSFNLVGGRPGSGKTTLAHQIMFALATPKRPAIYFTILGESPLKMLRYQQQYDFFDVAKIGESIHFVNLAEEVASGPLERVLARIVAEVDAVGPGLVFVDSFRSVTASRRSDADIMDLQQFIQRLSVMLASWQATTFLIGEYAGEDDTNPVFTVADGLIWLRQCVEGNSVVRQMEVVKMRGQATLPGLHTFRITKEGLTVFAPPPLAMLREAELTASPLSRVGLGVAKIDEMMGGGLPSGYSLLVAGPSGSGKSILATAFLAEGARQGEKGVIAVFEQRVNRSRGGHITELIESGRVGLVDTRAPDLSVDEITQVLVSKVEEMGATRVVIDSLSGFELALAPPFRDGFREALSRMLAALSKAGVTVLMTSEMEDRYDELRFSPYGTAFLTDAILVQRYIEVDSRLKRVMAVVKVRGSCHSDELHLFQIDDAGIQIGPTMPDYEGLLGGRPTQKIEGNGAARPAPGGSH